MSTRESPWFVMADPESNELCTVRHCDEAATRFP
jgi:hypothetical protein